MEKRDFKIPLKKCPLGCEEDVKFGSLEFCSKFEKREIPERKKIVQAKFICKKCLKPKKVHERNNGICKAPVCRTCGAGHHLMLCESVQEKKQLLKTGEKDDEDELHKNAEDSYLKEQAGGLDPSTKGQVQPGSSELEQDQETAVESSEEILEIENDDDEEALRKLEAANALLKSQKARVDAERVEREKREKKERIRLLKAENKKISIIQSLARIA